MEQWGQQEQGTSRNRGRVEPEEEYKEMRARNCGTVGRGTEKQFE